MAEVIVVGAGVSGLTVAWDLQRRGLDVAVLDASDRAGGKVWAAPLDGTPVDLGADSFLARVPAARELIDDLGLTVDIVHPKARKALLWLDETLRPVPADSVLGVPLDLDHLPPGTLSSAGLARARADLDRPGEPLVGDAAVGPLIRDRLGDEVFDRLVEPLLGGINAGNADELSLDVGAAQLAAAARRGGSLIAALRELTGWVPPDRRPPATEPAPVFLSLRGGAGALTAALVEAVGPALHLRTAVDAVAPRPGGGWSVRRADGTEQTAEQVVVATPAHVATHQLAALPAVSAALAGLRFASVAVVVLTLAPGTPGVWDDGVSGVLVPRSAGRFMTAVSFGSAKWPQWAPDGRAVLRASVGRIDDTRHVDMTDDALVAGVRADLADILGLTAEPTRVQVVRWPLGLAQFPPGHLDRTAELDALVAAEHPGLHLAGASYRGVGIPTCITHAHEVSARVLTRH